jgi:hypothetical protein
MKTIKAILRIREILRRLDNIKRCAEGALDGKADALVAMTFIVCESDLNIRKGKRCSGILK